MHFVLLRLVLLAGAALLLIACVAPVTAPAASTEMDTSSSTTLKAIKVDAVSLDPAAEFWANAPALTVPTVGTTEEAPDGPPVTMWAAYDAQNIAMRFEWEDATESMMKNAWTWDGAGFTKSGDEDRLQLIFAIENNPEFSSKGCAALCHNMDPDESKWFMGSEDPALRFDVIHWKAARTDPYGQADDQWIGVRTDPTAESGRVSDAKESGGYKDNVNEAGDGPAVMHGSDPAAAFIMAGEEVPVDTGALTVGQVIPGFTLSPFVGSRGDQTVQATWSDGKWVVVVMRALDTGHDDDVVFTPPKAYPFGLSITDNGGGTDHTNAPDVLTLAWE
ncbi:MAG: hypothetical protein H3C34_11565 [Caldilineaceae bacterium]|nr:hypothetical protein [Caldilineaceae bacterium]